MNLDCQRCMEEGEGSGLEYQEKSYEDDNMGERIEKGLVSIFRIFSFSLRPGLWIWKTYYCSVDNHCDTGFNHHQRSHHWNCCSIQTVCFYILFNHWFSLRITFKEKKKVSGDFWRVRKSQNTEAIIEFPPLPVKSLKKLKISSCGKRLKE